MSAKTMREMTRPDERMSMEEFGSDGKTDVAQKGGTASDEQEMRRMGKVQELRVSRSPLLLPSWTDYRKRNFKFVGIVGFVTILQATWEATLLALYPGLLNGGTAGVIWCTIAVWILMLCTIASMAEMASMCPTAGGQVSEFAPPSLQKPLSYVVGWCCCLGWISGVTACGVQLAGLVQAMVLEFHLDANVQDLWQLTLMIWLFILLAVGFNTFFAHHLPLAEGIVLFLHIFAFFAFLLVMWIMADHAPASQVFTDFHDGGGWGSIGLSCLVGLTTPIWCFIGPDAGAHMSEELKDASLQLPKAMMWATFGNGIMGIGMLITFCFCITDLSKDVLEAASDYPIVDVLFKATGSQAGTIILGCVMLVLLFFSTVTTIASASRQVWAFSRDCGLPFSAWIRHVPPTWEIPLNALLVCLGVSLVLSAINFGSATALNAIINVSNAALIFSYIVSIGCVRLKRLRGEPLLPRRWSLGKWGAPLNDISLLWLSVAFVFSFFSSSPYASDPEAAWWAQGFNW
ncbi:hypothetical protein LTR42_004396 [Elasticomyces elasticus]|nr:hypothetical protein LTR42_004396 [Elasticomyces elasticus]